jgi:hypothetical protein
MANEVFISYSSDDQKIVEELLGYLEHNGMRCFVAYRDIPKGVVRAGAIVDAIESCKVMVVVFSEDFNRSPQVDREIEICGEEKKPILPFRIQNVAFSGTKRYYLENLNRIDAFPNPQEYFGELCESVKKLLSLDLVKTLEASTPLEFMKNGDACYEQEDYVKAFDWYQRAANQGNDDAQINLGSMYEHGNGVQQDYSQAFEWYQKAANQGYVNAKYYLGDMDSEQDYAKAFEGYQKAANNGNADAQSNLGYMYLYGYGVQQNSAKAFEWCQKAAQQGNVNAQDNLGNMYYNGNGVEKDYAKAFEWYQKAVNQKSAYAQKQLKELILSHEQKTKK